jgi:hypothetical protein
LGLVGGKHEAEQNIGSELRRRIFLGVGGRERGVVGGLAIVVVEILVLGVCGGKGQLWRRFCVLLFLLTLFFFLVELATKPDLDVGDGVVMDLGVMGGFVWDILGVVLTKAGLYSSELPIFESVCKDQKKDCLVCA